MRVGAPGTEHQIQVHLARRVGSSKVEEHAPTVQKVLRARVRHHHGIGVAAVDHWDRCGRVRVLAGLVVDDPEDVRLDVQNRKRREPPSCSHL